METKNRFWKGVLVGAFITAFVGLIIVGISSGIILVGRSMIRRQAPLKTVESDAATNDGTLNMKDIEGKMMVIQDIIDEYFLFDEDPKKVEAGIYTGLMYGLDDPYSVYYTEEDFTKLLEDTNGEYCGIGVLVSQDRVTNVVTVLKVFSNGPSFEAGIQPGDIIYKVNGNDVTGMDIDLVVKDYIRGEKNTTVDITVFRQEIDDYVDVTVTRRNVEVPTVEHRMMENEIGYISVSQFEAVTSEQFKKAVDDLQGQGMKKLVIDLRSNPGGVLDAVVEMLDYILPDGLLVYTADKNGEGEKFYSKDGHQLDVPMAILVNSDSASASEVFAGAVRDFEKGKLVGTTTFGKGIVQSLFPLGDGTGVKLTVSHYYTPSGFDLHGKGLEPDIEVELKEELKTKAVVAPEEDNQLQAAVEYLMGES